MNNFKLLPRVDQKKTKKTTSRGHVRLGLGTACKQLFGWTLYKSLVGWGWIRSSKDGGMNAVFGYWACRRQALFPSVVVFIVFLLTVRARIEFGWIRPESTEKKQKRRPPALGRKRCQRRQVCFSCIVGFSVVQAYSISVTTLLSRSSLFFCWLWPMLGWISTIHLESTKKKQRRLAISMELTWGV
jgi:hypothetical protein